MAFCNLQRAFPNISSFYTSADKGKGFYYPHFIDGEWKNKSCSLTVYVSAILVKIGAAILRAGLGWKSYPKKGKDFPGWEAEFPFGGVVCFQVSPESAFSGMLLIQKATAD